jgi:hypothetical protein
MATPGNVVVCMSKYVCFLCQHNWKSGLCTLNGTGGALYIMYSQQVAKSERGV